MRNNVMRQFHLLLLASFASGVHAEIHTLTLREAVDRALHQNPDIALARLDEQKAAQAARIAKAPFSPAIFAGSGLAYSSGFPMSVDGAAPSIFQARAKQDIFNRQQSYLVASARENVRGAGIVTSAKRDEIAFRTASTYLDAQRAARLADLARKQVESLEKIQQTMGERVKEGRELPIQSKRAELQVARARQRVGQLAADQDAAGAFARRARICRRRSSARRTRKQRALLPPATRAIQNAVNPVKSSGASNRPRSPRDSTCAREGRPPTYRGSHRAVRTVCEVQ
jgi:outer membrane protein TolC